MAQIGCLGDIVFSVSAKQIKTLQDFKWDSSVKWAVHERHLQDPLLELTGLDSDTISFSMYFSKFCGVDPMAEITKLFTAERNGEVMRLILGSKGYGKNKWVISKTSRALQYFDGAGNVIAAKVDISLMAYGVR